MRHKTNSAPLPPRIALWLLKHMISRDIRYGALGDFEEIFATLAAEKSLLRARLWYWSQVIKSFPAFIGDKFYWKLSMGKNYLKIAFRTVKRHKAYSFINIAGLALGFTCVILIFLWVRDEMSFDRFHENAADIHRVSVYISEFDRVWPVISIPIGPALKKDFPEIIDSTRIYDDHFLLKRDNRQFEEWGGYVDPEFFAIFTFPFIKGDAENAFSSLHSIVITENLAEKLFEDEDPIGKTIQLNNAEVFTVTAVMHDVPLNSHIRFSFLLPYAFFEQRDRDPSNWGRFQTYTYVLLQNDVSFQEVEAKISGLLKDHGIKRGDPSLRLEPMTRIHLFAVDGSGDARYVYFFSIIAGFILLIACINFINLATARSSTRAKEVGVRKVTGAQRISLIRQFLGESVCLTILALLFAFGLVYVFLPTFNDVSGKQLTLESLGSVELLLLAIGIVLVTGTLSGSYPAFFLSAINPVNVLKGIVIPVSGRVKSSVFMKGLVLIQFAISIFLIIATLVISQQRSFIQKRNLGYDKEHIVSLPLPGTMQQQYLALKSELLQSPDIASVTAMSEPVFSITRSLNGFDWEGKQADEDIHITIVNVDHDYIKTLGMEMAAGRDFSEEFLTDTSQGYILNETAIKAMGMETPVGKKFACPTYEGLREGSIIGVVKDFNFKPLYSEIQPLAIMIGPERFNLCYVKLKADVLDVSAVIESLVQTWQKFGQNFPFTYSFLDDTFNRIYSSEQRAEKISGYFTFLALFTSCLGLFGLAAQAAERRTKEIGIRKVLGASTPGIVFLLSREFTKWILLANVIAWPAAYFVMNQWLQNFAYRTGLALWVFVLAASLALFIAGGTVVFQSIKSALANPVDSLRYE